MNRPDLVLVAVGGNTIALTVQEFARAVELGRSLLAPEVPYAQASEASTEAWLDAESMEAKTGVPASWWLEAARRGDIAHFRVGKYVRFSLSDAAGALKHRPVKQT